MTTSLWKCSKCGRRFSARNQRHSCKRFTVGDHLKGKTRRVLMLYKRFEALAKQCGPAVFVVPTKTRIGFQARTVFASVMLKPDGLHATLTLARSLHSPRFSRIETMSPRHKVHHLWISSHRELDKEVLIWMREAYLMGCQQHLRRIV